MKYSNGQKHGNICLESVFMVAFIFAAFLFGILITIITGFGVMSFSGQTIERTSDIKSLKISAATYKMNAETYKTNYDNLMNKFNDLENELILSKNKIRNLEFDNNNERTLRFESVRKNIENIEKLKEYLTEIDEIKKQSDNWKNHYDRSQDIVRQYSLEKIDMQQQISKLERENKNLEERIKILNKIIKENSSSFKRTIYYETATYKSNIGFKMSY